MSLCNKVHALRSCVQILIMSFPDKYHVHTLQQLLDTCLLLQPGVEIDSILSLLVQRICEHATANPHTVPITNRSAFTMLLSTARECGIRCSSSLRTTLKCHRSVLRCFQAPRTCNTVSIAL